MWWKMEYPTEVKMKLQRYTQAEDSSTRLNIQNQYFCYSLLQFPGIVFLIIIPVGAIENGETSCFNLPCRSINHLCSFSGVSMPHSAWCAFKQYLLYISLLSFPISFTQQEISSNSPALTASLMPCHSPCSLPGGSYGLVQKSWRSAMWCGMVQPAGKLGGESLAVCVHVWECGSQDPPQGTVLGGKTQVKNRHIFLVRIRKKKKCCDRWSKYLCFPQSHHLCARTKPLVLAPEDQHLQVCGCLEASHHVRPKKCSTTLGYLGTETKPCYSTTAELCVSELLPLALLAISWPGRARHICGFVWGYLPWGSPTTIQHCSRDREEPWGYAVLGILCT